MKKIYILILSALIFSINVKAQSPNFTWAKGMGSTGIDFGNAVFVVCDLESVV